MTNIRQMLDELVDTDPIRLRDEAYKILDRAERVEEDYIVVMEQLGDAIGRIARVRREIPNWGTKRSQDALLRALGDEEKT